MTSRQGRPHSNITIKNNIHSVNRQPQVHITNTYRLHGKPCEGTHELVETIKQVTHHNKIHGEKSWGRRHLYGRLVDLFADFQPACTCNLNQFSLSNLDLGPLRGVWTRVWTSCGTTRVCILVPHIPCFRTGGSVEFQNPQSPFSSRVLCVKHFYIYALLGGLIPCHCLRITTRSCMCQPE